MSIAIKVENLSKIYQIGEIGTGTLSRDMERWWVTKVMGKEDPFLKIGQTNDRSKKGESDVVYSLQDINFEIEQGDAVGIIGKNGAGKSTLLKILSRITSPTTGKIQVKGRVASLLEVGTGFHPELSGRDNIYLNGAILGMRKREINRKLDEIIDFSGVERYIDTPVKRYSSGMYVRLAFAVAAHLESEILIVDEVLAVGDAEFQKKCLGKMGEVSKGEGRTVLFVSHNMLAVKSLCSRGVLLMNGKIHHNDEISEVVQHYSLQNPLNSFNLIFKDTSQYTIQKISIFDNGVNGNFNIEDDLIIDIEINFKHDLSMVNINIFFNTTDGSNIFASCSNAVNVSTGLYKYTCKIPFSTLNDNIYSLDLMVVQNGIVSSHIKEILTIEGVEKRRNGGWLGKFPGLIRPTTFPWTIIKT